VYERKGIHKKGVTCRTQPYTKTVAFVYRIELKKKELGMENNIQYHVTVVVSALFVISGVSLG
jgi:hypothetical protein